MKIAILTDGIYPFVLGGMQKHSYDLVNHLLPLEVELTLVHCVLHNQELPNENDVKKKFDCDTSNLRVIGIKFPKPKRTPGHYLHESYQYSVDVFSELKEKWNTFDFIYAQGFTAWHLLKKKKRGRYFPPISVNFHGYEMFQRTKKIRAKLEQFMLMPAVVFNNCEADYVFSFGGEIAKIVKKIGVDPQKIVEIPIGISPNWLRQNHEESSGKRKFLFIGRNEERKGLTDLYKVIKRLGELNAEFHFVGPISPKHQLQMKNVTYYGKIMDHDKLTAIFDNCHVLLVPSHSEGMPNVILEGMARGLAVIASDVGAIPLMVNSNNGKLIPARDKKALETSIREFTFMSDQTLSEIQKNAFRTVKEKFSWKQIAEKILKEIQLKCYSSGEKG